jgi:hypothetical protein
VLTFSIALLVLEAPKLAQEFLLAMSTVKTVMSPKPHFLKLFLAQNIQSMCCQGKVF